MLEPQLVDPTGSYSATIMPRLKGSLVLIDDIITELVAKRNKIQKFNKDYFAINDVESINMSSLDYEKNIVFALESLTQIQKLLNLPINIMQISEILSFSLPVVRKISSCLYGILPSSSHQLCQLSSNLGSIAMDSAIITESVFDFRQSNLESNMFLDKAKLIADSKINKQYPNLDFHKPESE